MWLKSPGLNPIEALGLKDAKNLSLGISSAKIKIFCSEVWAFV
jgi:hypothetical protein